MPIDQLPDALDRVGGLVRAAEPRCGTTVVIAVDGRSGTGKTTYAGWLAERVDAPVLHLDDVYPGWDGLEAAVNIVAGDVLARLAAAELAAYDRWDWLHDRPGRRVEVPPTPLLVLEGVGAGALPAGGYAALTVWLEADEAVRKRRALARDGAVFARQWDRWAAEEQVLFTRDPVRERADLVVDTTTWADLDRS